MYRNNLKSLLLNYYPQDVAEQVYKLQMLDFLNIHEDCFERTCNIGHFTASCWLLNKTQDKALLLHHAKLNQWFQLGGHCDGDYNLLNVALKEAKEESGINDIEPISTGIFDIDIHLIPQIKKEKAHYHYDIRFLLQITSDAPLISNLESKDLKWFSKDKKQLPPVNASVIRMFDKWVGV